MFQECAASSPFRSKLGLTELHDRLSACCRKRDLCAGDRPAVKPPDPASHQASAFPVKSADEAVVLMITEEANEALIDTGASRAVTGSDRLLQTLPGDFRNQVTRAASQVQFRFGNSGVLSSTYALLFVRKTGGWIRVEVVPGQGPFLLSNSVLSGVRQWCARRMAVSVIPVKTCRQILSMSTSPSEPVSYQVVNIGDTPSSYLGGTDEPTRMSKHVRAQLRVTRTM